MLHRRTRVWLVRVLIVLLCLIIVARSVALEAEGQPAPPVLRPALVRAFSSSAVPSHPSPPLDPAVAPSPEIHGDTGQDGDAAPPLARRDDPQRVHEPVGHKQGKSNLSALSLSLIILLCLFTCLCVGSIFVRSQQTPEQAVTLVTEHGAAVGLEHLKAAAEEEEERARAHIIDLEEQKQSGERLSTPEAKPIDRIFGQPTGGDKENATAGAATAAAAEAPPRRHLRSYPSPPPPSPASAARNQQEGTNNGDDDAVAETKTSTSSVMGEQTTAGPPHPPAIAANVAEELPYQPTIIMHATQ